MRDETKGTRTNRIGINLPHHPGIEPPEPGVAMVTIDGQPIHAVHSIVIQAGSDMLTRVSIVFECEVSGVIHGQSVEDIIRNKG